MQNLRRIEPEHAGAVALVKGRLHGVRQAADALFAVVAGHAVNQQVDRVALLVVVFLDAHHAAVYLQPVVSLFHVHLQLLLDGAAFAWDNRCEHRKLRTFGIGTHAVDDILHGMLLHQLAAHGRVGLADACEEQSQVFVNLRGRAHRGTRVAAVHLLLDGDGRGDAFDEITLRLAHPTQELTGVRGEALHVTSLSLSV